jgi:hypothetical protein
MLHQASDKQINGNIMLKSTKKWLCFTKLVINKLMTTLRHQVSDKQTNDNTMLHQASYKQTNDNNASPI